MTDIYIISGFLGAGKTTFIQNLLKQTLQNEKVVIIENDFGEVNFDASLLSQCGYEVKALNSGCICCSIYYAVYLKALCILFRDLRGNFGKEICIGFLSPCNPLRLK